MGENPRTRPSWESELKPISVGEFTPVISVGLCVFLGWPGMLEKNEVASGDAAGA